MSIALQEAEKGIGFTNPNPSVGAIIVKNGEILARGFHRKAGLPHAEVEAISKLSEEQLNGSTLYVTLEPCCHYGRTPPCTELIIKSKIKEVVIGSYDNDERVIGKSIKILKENGINVVEGVLKEQCDKINQIFFFKNQYKRPYIIMKAAISLDGKIATYTNQSKWISNEKSREFVQKIRSRVSAIVVGGKTFRLDKPKLNCRLEFFENKILKKIVFSNQLTKDIKNQLTTKDVKNNVEFKDFYSNINDGEFFIVGDDITKKKENFIEFCNKNEIDSILIEGGHKIYTWFLKNDLIDKIYLFYRMAFLGNDGIPVIDSLKIEKIDDLNDFQLKNVKILDDNILIELDRRKIKFSLEL